MKQQSERLGLEPIPKLLRNMALPAISGMIVMALYNVVDTIFVARFVGTLGVAAVSIAFPVQMIIMALAGATGIGGASAISRMLGAKESDEANRIFGNVLSLVILISLVGVFLGFRFLDSILYAFGASEAVLPLAQDYLGVILYGSVFFAFGFAMNNIVRSEGNAKMAMMTMMVSSGLNIVLTPIFITILGLGVKGSALATVLAQGFTAIYLVHYFLSGKSSLKFHVAYLVPRISIINKILSIGSSAFVQQVSSSAMFIVANHMLANYGGDMAVAVFGIVFKILMFSLMPVMGIVQGMLPLVGYNYGANLSTRVSESISLAMKSSTIIVFITFSIIMLIPHTLMLIFTSDPVVIQTGQTALRIMFAMALTLGVQMVTGGVFQALGKARVALILSLSRQVFFLIPLLLLLPLFFGLKGVWMAFPVADVLSFLLALWFIRQHQTLFLRRDEVPATS